MSEAQGALNPPFEDVGTVDLYQTDSHGLDVSNNPVLVDSIRPRVVVVNNGPMKGAELNTMRTLKSNAGIETLWQVHRNIRAGPELNTDPRFIANLEATCRGDFI